jgi:hypothetical protein
MLENILYQFNNREYAIAIWLFLVLFIWISRKDIRNSIYELICSKFLLQMLFVATTYNILITLVLYKIWIWSIEYFKESLYWCLGSSLVFFFNIKKIDNWWGYIKNTLIQLIWITSILAFIGNFYTFSFIVELILQPFLFFVILMLSFAESYENKNPKYKITITFLNYILGITITIILVRAVYWIQSSPNQLFQINNLIYFLYPLFYIILFYPFLYIFRLLMQYESLFARIKIRNSKKKSDYFYVKRKIILFCWINLVFLNKFSTWRMFWMENKDWINTIISDFKKINNNYNPLQKPMK